jgi:hypothetical protein
MKQAQMYGMTATLAVSTISLRYSAQPEVRTKS